MHNVRSVWCIEGRMYIITNNSIENQLVMIFLRHRQSFQSAYKPFYGTETALLRVNNDILSAMDDGKITALVLLYLSAAFDTVDHKILLSRLQYHLGIHDIALDWCKSYLLNRPQHVCIGSVLGPQWFTVYTSPVRDIILKYNLNYHVYADDTQLYITFKSSQEPADSCITTLEKCIQETKVSLPFITIGDSQITPSSQARNLGVIFDSTMTLKPHISNIVRVSSFHIRNISRIRKYLNQSAAEQIIHAFVTSRLDNGNALFYGLPQNQISRLQHIQNTESHAISLQSWKNCTGFLFHRELFLNLC